MTELSEEARARIRAEARAVMERVMSGAPAPRERAPEPEEPGDPKEPSRRGENLRQRRPTYDHDEIIRLFSEEKKRVTEIAAITGAHRMTISRVLNKAGFDPAERKGGPTRRETCERGHDMAVHGKPVKSGGRYCAKCRRLRERGEI